MGREKGRRERAGPVRQDAKEIGTISPISPFPISGCERVLRAASADPLKAVKAKAETILMKGKAPSEDDPPFLLTPFLGGAGMITRRKHYIIRQLKETSFYKYTKLISNK
jgi:hypothetical protein